MKKEEELFNRISIDYTNDGDVDLDEFEKMLMAEING